jgi:23S rRNA (guanine745-N1)-methyltransferase
VQLLACPLCGAPLTRDSASLVCAQQHRFDIAREGYVNLFPAHHRGSRNPGDEERMVVARRRFLDAGHYAPLCAALTETLTAACGRIDAAVDLGCGDGYFTATLASVDGTHLRHRRFETGDTRGREASCVDRVRRC